MAHWTPGAAFWPPQDQHYWTYQTDDEESAHGSSISPTPRQVQLIGPSRLLELHPIGEGVAAKCVSGASDADAPPPGRDGHIEGATLVPASEGANNVASWFAMSSAIPSGEPGTLSPRIPPPSSAEEAASAASAATAAVAGLLFPAPPPAASGTPCGGASAASSSPTPTPRESRVGFAEGVDNGGMTLTGPAAADLLDPPLAVLETLEMPRKKEDTAESDTAGELSREESWADGASSSAAGPDEFPPTTALPNVRASSPTTAATMSASAAVAPSKSPPKSGRPKAKNAQRRRSTPGSQSRSVSPRGVPKSAAGPGKERQRLQPEGHAASAFSCPAPSEVQAGSAAAGTKQAHDGSVMEEGVPGGIAGGSLITEGGARVADPDIPEGLVPTGQAAAASSNTFPEERWPQEEDLEAAQRAAQGAACAPTDPLLRDGMRPSSASSAVEVRELRSSAAEGPEGPEGPSTPRTSWVAGASTTDGGSPRPRRSSNADRFGLSPDRQSSSSGSSRKISNRASDFGSRVEEGVFKALRAFTTNFPASCPAFCVIICIAVVGAIVGFGFRARSVQVESEFEEFLQTNAQAEAANNAFQHALKEQSRRLQTEITVYASVFDLQVAYELQADSGYDSIFDFDAIVAIRQFERWLRSMPAWRRFCDLTRESDRLMCEPGVSFATYALPTQQYDTVDSRTVVPRNLILDGEGKDILPIQTAFSAIKYHNLTGLFLQSGFTSLTYGESYAVRSVFRFRIVCCDETLPEKERRRIAGEQKAEWQDFVRESLLPALQDPSEGLKQPDSELLWPIHIYYDGTDMQTVEVTESLMKDLQLALGSMLLVTAYMVYYTHSLVLSAVGVMAVVAAWPVAFVLFTAVAGTAKLSIAAFLSVFLAAGFGADMIILYTDAWRSTDRGYPLGPEIAEARLVEAYQQGVKASFPTTLATAMYFMANIFAALRPMRDFGLLMGLCVIVAWCLITLIYFPVCLLEEQHCKWMRVRGRVKRSYSHENRLSTLWVSHLRLRRRWYFLLFLAIIVGIWFISDVADNSDEVSGAFPLHHNQNRGKEVLKGFTAPGDTMPQLEPAPPPTVRVCDEQEFHADVTSSTSAGCAFFWCEVDGSQLVEEAATDDICHCYRSRREGCAYDAPVANATQRLIGRSSLADNQLESLRAHFLAPSAGEIASGLNFSDNNATHEVLRTTSLPPVLLQEWESGGSTFTSALQVEATLLRLSADSSCGWKELCFCGTPVCHLQDTWDEFGAVNLGEASGAPMLPRDQAALVSVVFGIDLDFSDTSWFGEAGEISASWQFNGFDPTVPDAQRSLRSWCLDPPRNLQVQERNCWIEDFRTYVVRFRGDRFPTLQQDFNLFLQDYLQEGASDYTTELPSAEYLWLSSSGELQAFYYKFALSTHKDASVEVARDLLQNWDNAMLYDSWHTSELWIKATEPVALKRGMVVAGSIMGFFVFLGTMIFTCNCALPLLVVLSTVAVIVAVTFVLFVTIGWAMGPIEVITVISLTGYAVSYSARVAIKYGGSEFLQDTPMPGYEALNRTAELRLQRTFFAVRTSGEPSVHSALTMVGSSVFLIFCTITVFQKLGIIMIAMALTSLFVALGALPAALLSTGPAEPRRSCCLEADDVGVCMGETTNCLASAANALVVAEQYASSSIESFGRPTSTAKATPKRRRREEPLTPKSEAIGATAGSMADSSAEATPDAASVREDSPAPREAAEASFPAVVAVSDVETGDPPASLMSERREGDVEVPRDVGSRTEAGGIFIDGVGAEQPEASSIGGPNFGWDAFSRGGNRTLADPQGLHNRGRPDRGSLMHDHDIGIVRTPVSIIDPSAQPRYQRAGDGFEERRRLAARPVSTVSDFEIGNESSLQAIQVNAVMPMKRMGRSRSPSSNLGSRSNSRQLPGGSMSDLGAAMVSPVGSSSMGTALPRQPRQP